MQREVKDEMRRQATQPCEIHDWDTSMNFRGSYVQVPYREKPTVPTHLTKESN